MPRLTLRRARRAKRAFPSLCAKNQFLPCSMFSLLGETIIFCLMLFISAKNHHKRNEGLALQRENAENLKQIFPEKEYRGLGPNFHIHVSVSELHISTIGLPFLLEETCGPILGIYKSLTDTGMWKLGLRPCSSWKRNI